MRIRNIKGGVFYRPVDTPAGKAGWCADLFYERFTPYRNNKGNRDQRQAIRANWTMCEWHYGPCQSESEAQEMYTAKRQELAGFVNDEKN